MYYDIIFGAKRHDISLLTERMELMALLLSVILEHSENILLPQFDLLKVAPTLHPVSPVDGVRR